MAQRPILVTGVPRSGTTWLARLLTTSPGTALAGREPMNPRGRQYALGGTLRGWTRLLEPSRSQRLRLRSAYLGLNPWVYSRYGRRQWAAALPRTRIIVKDPFAMLSVPAVTGATRARTVLLYRHPGAILTSYRRMGWLPDLDELRPIVTAYNMSKDQASPEIADLPAEGAVGEAEAMGHFWNALYTIALDDLRRVPDALVVAHEEVARGGAPAGRRLFCELGLTWSKLTEEDLAVGDTPASADPRTLHNLERSPVEVAGAWRSKLSPADLSTIETVTEAVQMRLASARLAVCNSA
jgi:hypothetical protein